MTTVDSGKLGEDLAVSYLKKLGYKIISRNFRIRGGEIDIVAIDGDVLVYVEVKTRTSHQFGYPEESITKAKIKFLERSAKFYRNNKKNLFRLPKLERIDVLAVDFSNNQNPSFRLIKNASF